VAPWLEDAAHLLHHRDWIEDVLENLNIDYGLKNLPWERHVATVSEDKTDPLVSVIGESFPGDFKNGPGVKWDSPVSGGTVEVPPAYVQYRAMTIPLKSSKELPGTKIPKKITHS
jgi:hypothetical protein